MMDGSGMMAGMGWLGMLSMILVWVAVIVLAVWAISKLFAASPRTEAHAEPDALETLRRRFARGEISHEEFEQRRVALH